MTGDQENAESGKALFDLISDLSAGYRTHAVLTAGLHLAASALVLGSELTGASGAASGEVGRAVYCGSPYDLVPQISRRREEALNREPAIKPGLGSLLLSAKSDAGSDLASAVNAAHLSAAPAPQANVA